VAVLQPRLAIDGGMGLMGEPLGVVPLLVEALVGLGRHDEAADLTRRLDVVTPADAPAILDAPRHRCLALVEEDPGPARAAYEAAITAYAAAPDVFELARTRLLLGSWLRRRGDRTAAREQLGLAADAFARMELTAWVAKAHAERAATGERPRPRGEHPLDEPLTSQETRVALLVAQGLSNKEVAAHLFLSPRTVETHLSSVFRKRGFRNRTDLAVRGLGS
jgi:DNA-binding NarL/FixJ family response regulator